VYFDALAAHAAELHAASLGSGERILRATADQGSEAIVRKLLSSRWLIAETTGKRVPCVA
jgi:hypothetical protein